VLSVKPINYAISLHHLELGGSFSYQGRVRIELDVKKATKAITLNAHELKIVSAKVHLGEAKCEQDDARLI
jgi:aminopeptidase N